MAEAGGTKLASLYAEIDLDRSKLDQKLDQTVKDAEVATIKIDKAWKGLGGRQEEYYEKQRLAAEKNYKAIIQAGGLTANELVAVEMAKAAKIEAINARQYAQARSMMAAQKAAYEEDAARQAAIAQTVHAQYAASWQAATKAADTHGESMAALTRTILRLYAAYYVLSTGVQGVIGLIKQGIEAVDNYNLATVKTAAIMTGMMKEDGRSLGDRYKEAYTYAGQLNKVLEEVDKNTMLNFQQLQDITVEMMKQGVVLNTNSKAEIAAFTQISNALATIAAGTPNKEIQLRQEIRALLQGQVRDTDQLAQMIDAQLNGKLKEQITLHKKNGDLVIWLGEQLKGFAAAQDQINASWETAKSTLQTTYNQVLRQGFQTAFKDIVASAQALSEWAIQHKQELGSIIDGGWSVLKGIVGGTITSVSTLIDLTKKFKDEVIAIGAGLLAMQLPYLLTTIIGLVKELTTVVVILATRAWAAFGPIGVAIGAIIYGYQKLSKQSAVEARIEELERMKAAAEKTGKGVADINAALEQQRKLLNSNMGPSIPYDTTEYNYPINQPTLNPRTDSEAEKKGAKAAQEWVEIQRTLTAEMEKTALTSNKWDDKLIAINKRYQDILDKTKGIGGETPVPVDKGFMDKWKSTMIANVEAERQKEITQFDIKSEEERMKRQEHYATEYERLFMDISHKRGVTNAEALSKIEKDEEKALSKIAELELASYWDKETNRKKDVISYEEAERLKEDVSRASYARRVALEAKNSVIYLDYMRTAAGQYSAVYEEIYKAQLENLADQEQQKVEATGKEFDREAWLAAKTIEFYDQRLQAISSYYSKIDGLQQKAYQATLKSIEATRKAEIAAGYDIEAANAKARLSKAEAFNTAYLKPYETALGGVSNALENISLMYDENTKQRKQFHDAAVAFSLVEQGLMTAQAVISGVAAVINAMATGDPYTAIARAVAVAAVVATYLAKIGVAFNGGSGSDVPAETTPVLPASTVLGAENGTASESIKKSWELLQDTYDMEYRELSGIYNEMKDLNNNITGLVKNIILTGGITAEGMQAFIGEKGAMEKFIADFGSRWASTLNWINDLLGPLGDIFGKWANSINSVLGKIAGGIFGGETSYRYSPVAIELDSTTVKALIDGMSLTGRTSRAVRVAEDGGWFGDDEYSYFMQYGKLDANVLRMFTMVFANISQTLVSLAEGLGGDMEKTLAYAFDFPAVGNLTGSADEINEKISAWINKISDQAVEALFGEMIKQYQNLGEGLYETATRLLIDKAVVLDTLAMTGKAFTGTAKEAVAMAEDLIYLAGDLETLREKAETYYDKFFTDAEKQARLQGQLSDAMADMNRIFPTTREGYRALVEMLDLNTEAGREAYVTMMALAEAADAYYSTEEEIAKNRRDLEMQLMDSADALAAKRADELAAMDAALRPLQELVWLTEDWAEKLKDATSTTTDAISTQISAANTAASAARSAAKEYRSISESLTEAIEKIRDTTTATASDKFSSLYETAMTGDRASLSALPGAADSLLEASKATSKTAEDYARDQGKTLIALSRAEVVSSAMVNWEEYQAALLDAQVGVLEEIKEELEKESPDLVLLEQQAGLLTTISTLLTQQTQQIAKGNGEQALLMMDQTGKIVLANQLTTDQTGKIVLGNSWLSNLASGVRIESADVIGQYLNAVAVNLMGNNSAEAARARAAVEALRQTTSDGLITAAEAQSTVDALAVLNSNTTALQTKALVAGSAAALQAATNAANIAKTITAGDSAQLIADATATVQASNNANMIKQQIATGSLNITTSQSINAAEIGKGLSTAQTAIVDNNRTEAVSARAAIAMLQQTTKDGIITVAEATATTEAIASLRNSTMNLLSQEILATNKAVSETTLSADRTVQTTLKVQAAVISGASFSAESIGKYLTEVEKALADNNSKEAVAARGAIDTLRKTTADGLITTAEAETTRTAISTLQNATTGILSKSVSLGQSSLSASAAQASTALQATVGVQESIKYSSKFSADTVGAYLAEVETALKDNNSAEAEAAREAIASLREVTADGLIATAEASATKAAIATLQASTSTLLSQSLAAQQKIYLSQAVQMAEVVAKTEKVSTTVTSGAVFSATKIGEYLNEVEGYLAANNSAEAQAARAAIGVLRTTTADGFIATAEAANTTSALSTLQGAMSALLKQSVDLDSTNLSESAKQAASALSVAMGIHKTISESAVASMNEMQKLLTAASTALANNNTSEATKARAAIATLEKTTKDGFISTAEAESTTSAIYSLQSTSSGLLSQEILATNKVVSNNTVLASGAAQATERVRLAVTSGASFSATTIGNYLTEVEKSLVGNESAEAARARESIALLRQTTASGLITTANAATTTSALASLQNATSTLLNQEVILDKSALSADSANAASALQATLKVQAAVSSGASFSALAIGGYLAEVEEALAANNSIEAKAARDAITILRQTTATGLIETSKAEATKAAIATLQASTATLLNQNLAAQNATTTSASIQSALAVQATAKVQAAIAAGVDIKSAVTIGKYLSEVEAALVGNSSKEATDALNAINALKTATSSGLASSATAATTVAALAQLRTSTATLLNQSVALETSTLTAEAKQAQDALTAALGIQSMVMKDTTATISTGGVTQAIIQGQTAQIINGNLIIKDQTGKIVATNELLTSQTGAITLGNELTDDQTVAVLTGVAIQDAIKNLSNLNKTYNEEMLQALIKSGSAQTSNLEGLLEANNRTVSLLQQLIDLTDASRQDKWIMELVAAEKGILSLVSKISAAQEEANKASANIEVVRKTATQATKSAAIEESSSALSAYQTLLATFRKTTKYAEVEENLSTGTAFSASGYLIPAASKAAHDAAYQTYLKAFQASYALKDYIAPDTDPNVAAAISYANVAATELAKAKTSLADAETAYAELVRRYEAAYGTVPGHATGLTRVPYDDYLMRAHKDEAVLTAPQAKEWRESRSEKGGGGNSALIEEVKKLRQETSDLKAYLYNIRKDTLKTAKTLEKFDYDGLPAERVA